MTYKEEIAYNKSVLDKLPLPAPFEGEDINDYICRIDEMFGDKVPDDMGGFPFNYMTDYEVGEYIGNRFGCYACEITTTEFYYAPQIRS